MSLILADGFDHYTTPNQKWTVTGSPTISGAAARYGVGGLSCTAGATVSRPVGVNCAEIIAGFAWKPGGAGSGQDICRLRDGTQNQMSVAEECRWLLQHEAWDDSGGYQRAWADNRRGVALRGVRAEASWH